MKNHLFICGMLLLTGILLNSCQDKTEANFMANTPVYMDFDTFRSTEFTIQPVREITASGKIWVKGHYLFIVDVLKGVHIVDNSNPSSPVKLGFLEIFACSDIAISGNLLFADNYSDLLTFDISDILNPALQCRTENAFNFTAIDVIGEYDYNLPAVGVIWNKGVITGWNQEEVTEEIAVYSGFNNSLAQFDSSPITESSGTSSISTVSVGGSMARFTITGDHLHTIESSVLTSYSITNTCPEETATTFINRIGETLFSAEGNLFIGTTTGMLIYGLSDPGNPTYISDFQHVASCDPVVISGDKAYVTLRTGTRCQGDINELVIINISDLSNPTEMAAYDMSNPHGLGVVGSTLFLCDGSDGLKVYDVENPYDLENNLISHFSDIQTYDIIPLENQLIMSAKEGIYQFDYSDLSSITQLSLIPVQ